MTALPNWLESARGHLREHYPHDGLAESCLWALYAAGFGVASLDDEETDTTDDDATVV